MKHFSIFATLALLCVAAIAGPVNMKAARTAGTHYLQREGLIKADDTLSLALVKQYNAGEEAITTFYVFNYQDRGFVIVSADNRCTPILGYSMNGCFNESRMPANMLSWIEQYSTEIATGIRNNAPEDKAMLKEWAEVLDGEFNIPPAPKADDYLVQSTWEQGYGYNKYCPQLNGQNVVVGCVATAMAQIIRYYEYPTRGFGSKSYTHNYYGQLGVSFDTSEYDYSLMPLHVTWRSNSNEIDMVSRLCYHCGVVVSMNYQDPNNTDGSGAQTSRVVDGLLHFGYTNAQFYSRSIVNDDTRWINMIKNEIDNQRPIEYSGFSDSYGHAFVLDGYRNTNKYHFNWGWGGMSDGWYTLTTMQGFVQNNQMVINIYPSGWDGHADKFYCSPDGTGNGTSWDQANKNLEAAIVINTIEQHDIWMKEGTYTGSNSGDFAFDLVGSANITGGFEGTESSVNERTPKLHPTILDGQNRHGVLSATNNNGSSRALKLTDIVLANGHRPNGECVRLKGVNVNANFLTVNNCQSDTGCIINIDDSKLRMAIITNNSAPTICNMNGGTIRQSLISNNDAQLVVSMNETDSRMVNCDIVSNLGTGVKFNASRSSFVNNIVWNNDTSMVNHYNLNDTSIRNCAIESDTTFADSTWVRLGHDNAEVRFINPTSRGTSGMTEEADWHLDRGSACIDKGEKLCTTDGDLDRAIRCRNGIIDLGCYESNYPVSINSVGQTSFNVYPNPATSTITIDGMDGNGAWIIDINGRAVMQINGKQTDISALSPGVYYLRSQGHTAKFIKQ